MFLTESRRLDTSRDLLTLASNVPEKGPCEPLAAILLNEARPSRGRLQYISVVSVSGSLRRIFGPRRDEVTEEWRRLHNEELNGLYSSPNIMRVIKSRRMRWAGHVARMGEERGAYKVLVGKPEGKRPLGRPRRRWVDNIRMDLQEVGCGMWTGLGYPRIGRGGGSL